MFAMIFAEDRAAAVREAHRVLRPGGMAACAGWGPLKSVDWIYLSNKVRAKKEGIARARTAHGIFFTTRDDPLSLLHSNQGAAAGF